MLMMTMMTTIVIAEDERGSRKTRTMMNERCGSAVFDSRTSYSPGYIRFDPKKIATECLSR